VGGGGVGRYILFNDILVHCEMSKTMTKSLTSKDKSKRGTMNLKDLTQQKLFKYKGAHRPLSVRISLWPKRLSRVCHWLVVRPRKWVGVG
jgi:hypothetical protein